MQAAAPLKSSQHSISSLSLQNHVPKPNRLLLLLLSSHSYPNITNAGCGCRRLSLSCVPKYRVCCSVGKNLLPIGQILQKFQISQPRNTRTMTFRTRSSMIFASKGKNNKPNFTSQTSETSLLTNLLVLSANQRFALHLLGPTTSLRLTSSHA
jgi:hypothetical protein